MLVKVAQSVVNYAWNKFKGVQAYTPSRLKVFDGEKFHGGLGAVDLFEVDYWTLRKRSAQLFNENLYAKGLIRRLITNEVNTGLTAEAAPDEEIIGLSEDSLSDWTETVENRFGLWAKNPELCDWSKKATFGAIQRQVRLEALVSGDVLIILRQSQKTKLPMIQLVGGDKVRTPIDARVRKGHEIKHGVEFDSLGRVAAHWITQNDGTSKRVPAVGEKSGRKISWLVFGTEKRLDDVRGQPLLSIVLQSLKEIDRYRDSVQRKAVINSILAMFISKTDDKPGTKPFGWGAQKTGEELNENDSARRYEVADQIPGVVIQELQKGEEPKAFNYQGTDQAFGAFEEAIIQAVAWANQIPPEILRLAFSNNYSASQAAINEFKIYLNLFWSDFGECLCSPIYTEWFISELLQQKIQAPGFLESWRDPHGYDIYGAWLCVDWYGSIKPSTDSYKQGKGSELLVKNGWSTNAREARVTTGTKFSKNMKRQLQENKLKARVARPLLELEKEFGKQESTKALENIEYKLMELVSDKE